MINAVRGENCAIKMVRETVRRRKELENILFL